jgi:predicted extracellular nuclease
LAQVGVVGRWAEERLEADPHARLVVLGDLNETEHRAPLVRLAAAGLENLTLAVPRNRRYTFNHQGFSQLLDHVLVSPALAPGAAARVIHINADFPAARRASDHDPILVRLCPAGGCSERRPR